MNQRERFNSGLIGLIFVIAFTVMAGAQTVSYNSLDAPLGINGTYAQGISGKQIVGQYFDGSYTAHGFIYDGTNFTTIDPPNSQLTSVRGTDGHRVTGYFVNTTGTHGFVWDGANYTTLNDPEAFGVDPVTSAYGIDGTNIVGYYTSNTIPHGFLYNGKSYSTIDYPGGTYGSYAQGISGTNIVGLGYDVAPGNGHSFIYNGKTFITIPNSITNGSAAIDALSISGNVFAGYYFDGVTDHGFVWEPPNYIVLNYPKAKLTTVYGIDGNTVVGSYFDAQENAHGFEAIITQTPLMTIIRLGSQIVVSWPANAGGWTLQTNGDLTASVWGNYTGTVINNTVTNRVPSNGTVFYRLIQP